jgi:hypothetical protein
MSVYVSGWQRMGWTGRAPAPNGSQSRLGTFEEHEEASPCPAKEPLQLHVL